MKAWLLAAAPLLLAGCATLDKEPDYLTGAWGGPHIGIGFQGALANVQFDCASGSIDGLIFPAKDGSFEAKGTYRAGTPGPVRVGQIFVSQPAGFTGNALEGVMTLSVQLDDGTQLGPFSLTKGAPAQLTRCL